MYSFFLFWHLWLLRIGDHRLICSPDSKTWLIYIVFFVFHVLPEPLKSTFHGLPKLRMHHFKIMQNKKFLHLSLPLFRRYDLLSTQAESNLSRIICSTFNDVCLSEVSIPHRSSKKTEPSITEQHCHLQLKQPACLNIRHDQSDTDIWFFFKCYLPWADFKYMNALLDGHILMPVLQFYRSHSDSITVINEQSKTVSAPSWTFSLASYFAVFKTVLFVLKDYLLRPSK